MPNNPHLALTGQKPFVCAVKFTIQARNRMLIEIALLSQGVSKAFQGLGGLFQIHQGKLRSFLFLIFFKNNFLFAHTNIKNTLKNIILYGPKKFSVCIANRPKISPILIFCSIKSASCGTFTYIHNDFA